MATDFAALGIRIDTSQVKTATADLDRLAKTAGQAEKQTTSLTGSARKLGAAFGAIVGSVMAREVMQAADSYKLLNARIELASRSVSEFVKAQRAVFDIAQRTRVSLEETGNLYTSLARSTSAFGASQDEVLKVTEAINKSLIISGTSAQAAQAALIQLGQGFSSGVLRGEELNSVLEQAPRLAKAIADGLGVPIGKLRELGKQGELTAQQVFNSLLKSTGKLEAEFARMPTTVGQSLTQVSNSLSTLIGKVDEATGATSLLAKALQGISGWLDFLSRDLPATISLGMVARDLNNANTELKRLQALKISPWSQMVPDLDKQIALAEKKFEAARRRFRIADGRLGTSSADDESAAEARRLGLRAPTFVPEPVKPEHTPLTRIERDLAADAIRSLEDQIRATQDLSTRQEILAQIELGRLGKVSEAQRTRLLQLAEELDAAEAMKVTITEIAKARERADQMLQRANENSLAAVQFQIDANQTLRDEIEVIGLDEPAP